MKNIIHSMNKWFKKTLSDFFKQRLTWLLIFLSLGIVAYIFGFFVVETEGWHDFCFQAGNILIVGVVLGFLSNGEHFLSIFQQAIQNVVYGKEFLANQKEIFKYWKITSKQMFENKFPNIHEDFLDLINSYFPTDEVSYYNDYEMISSMSWVDEENDIVKVTDTVSFDLIADTEGEFIYPLKIWFKVGNNAEHEASSKMKSFKVNKKELTDSIEPEILIENGERCEKRNIPLSGSKEYHIEYHVEKTLNIKEDHCKGFRAKYIVKNCRVEYDVPENIHIQFESRGTRENFEDVGPQKSNKISKRYRGILLPKQGFIMALQKNK